MSLEGFNFTKEIIEQEIAKQDGYLLFEKITGIINHVGRNFSEMLGGEMAETKYKLSGYKYYLSTFIGDLQRMSEFYHLEIKNYRAGKWGEISETIKAEKGKVSNKEEIENEIIKQTYEMHCREIVYENLYYQYKIKLSAMDDIITCLTQRISELKRQMDTGI